MRADSATAAREGNNAVSEALRTAIDVHGPRLGVHITFVEREGNPYTEIVRLAKELRVDAVVVGASTQAGHRLVGSLAVHLVRDAQWPVTVVPWPVPTAIPQRDAIPPGRPPANTRNRKRANRT